MNYEYLTRTIRYCLYSILTSGSPDLDVESVDAQLLAPDGDVLSSQHGGVGRGFVTVGLDLHATSNTAHSFAATGITQNISLMNLYYFTIFFLCAPAVAVVFSKRDEPEIGNVNESIVEGGEDASDAEDELIWRKVSMCNFWYHDCIKKELYSLGSRTGGPKEMFS